LLLPSRWSAGVPLLGLPPMTFISLGSVECVQVVVVVDGFVVVGRFGVAHLGE